MILEVTKQLAEFAVNIRYENIPSAVRDQAKIAIADSIGTVFAGLKERSVALLHQLAASEFRDGHSTVLGGAARLTDAGAAFANAASAHALDYDSLSLPVGFVATAVLFPLLAVAEEEGNVSGRDLLSAFTAGYEVEVAIARGLGVHHWSKGWHSTSTLAHFGAAVGVARLLKLDVERMRDTIGLAASESSGLRNMMGNMVKVFHMAKAARNGVFAARLAQRGFTAHLSSIEAEWGYCNSFNGVGGYDLETMLKGLGVQYDLVDPGLVVKVYPCCGLIHSALDGLLDLRGEHRFTADEVSHVQLRVHELVPRTLCFNRPRTTYEARFSAHFCIATTLQEGALKLSHFSEDRLHDARLQRLMERVEVVVHPELHGDGTFLQNEFTEIRIELLGGKAFERRIYRVNNRGSGGRPIELEERKRKFLECTQGHVERARSERAFKLLTELETVSDVREIVASLR